jgi:hypothetical protein
MAGKDMRRAVMGVRRLLPGYSGRAQGGLRVAKPSAELYSHSSVKGSAGV